MSFLANGTPAYDWKMKVAALDATAYMNWKPLIQSMVDKLPASADEATLKDICPHDLLMDEAELNAWNSIAVDVAVTRVKGMVSNTPHLPDVIYQIAVANVGLLQVQRVEVLDDCCTDTLQRELDRGWRLLAVCPPNNTRRPAYIVGHFDKNAGE